MNEFNPDLQKADILLRQMAADGRLPFIPDKIESYTQGGGTLSLRVVAKDGVEYAVLFPRDSRSLKSKSDEKIMLDFINSHNIGAINIPTLTFENNEALPFFWMQGFKGDVLLPMNYGDLNEKQKQLLAVDLARFLYAMHSLPVEKAKDVLPTYSGNTKGRLLKLAGLSNIEELHEILDKKIPEGVLQTLDNSVDKLNYENVVSHGDLHGRNMAVDKSKEKVLNGIFDFGDARIANRAVDFYKLSVVHRELMRRTVDEYNKLSPEKVKVADVDFVFLALFGSRIKQNPKDRIINESLQNFSDDWRDSKKDKFQTAGQKLKNRAAINEHLINKFQND